MNRPIPSIAFSIDALDELIQGRALCLDLADDTIRLESCSGELVIDCDHLGETQQYRVSLSQLALSSTMLARFDRAHEE